MKESLYKVYFHTIKGMDNGFVLAKNIDEARQLAAFRYGHNVRKIVKA